MTQITLTRYEYFHRADLCPYWMAYRTFGPDKSMLFVREENGDPIRSALAKSPFVTSLQRLTWSEVTLANEDRDEREPETIDGHRVIITDWDESPCRCERPGERWCGDKRIPAPQRLTVPKPEPEPEPELDYEPLAGIDELIAGFDRDRQAAEEAARETLPEWQAFNVPASGNVVVDLAPVWGPLWRAVGNYRGMDLVRRLPHHIAHGAPHMVAWRLVQALDEMRGYTPDGRAEVALERPQPDRLIITAWQRWRSGVTLPWWVRAEVAIEVTDEGRTRTHALAPAALVTWQGRVITYRDAPDGPLTGIVVSWLTGYLGRAALRGEQPDLDPVAISVEEFTAGWRS